MLRESVGAFFSARQVAHCTRSWSSGKMLAFQSRGFVFEPVSMRSFFYIYYEAEGSHFFRHYESFRLCETFFRFFLSPKSPPFFFLIFCNKTNVKNPKGSFFQNCRHYETAIKISHFLFFFRKFFKDSKESPFNFLNFCNRMDVKKFQRVPSFTVSGIVAFFKRSNFCVKMKFSQVRHAVSDFCCFKRPVFFYATFSRNLFHRSPSSIFARNETFCES